MCHTTSLAADTLPCVLIPVNKTLVCHTTSLAADTLPCVLIDKAKTCRFGQIFRVPEVIHIICNMGAHDLPDMYALGPAARGLWAYISGKSFMPMLQLLHVCWILTMFIFAT